MTDHLDLAFAAGCFTLAAGCFAFAWIMREWSWWDNGGLAEVDEMRLGDPYSADPNALDNLFLA